VTGIITDPVGTPTGDLYVDAAFGTLPKDGAKAGEAIEVYASPSDTGEYTFYLPAGTYDFTYEPFDTTTLACEAEQGVAISADTTHDFQFSETPVTVSGRVTINGIGPQAFFGTLLSFVDVILIDQYGMEYWGMAEFNGDYEVPVAPGNTYTVMLNFDVIMGLTDLVFYTIPEMETGLVPSKDITRNYDLTMYTVSGHVLRPDGTTPVTSANITISNDIMQIVYGDGQADGDVEFVMNRFIAGGTGAYEVFAPAGEMQMNFSDVDTGHIEFVNDVLIDADRTLDFVFAWEDTE